MFRVCPRDQTTLVKSRFMTEVMDACSQCDGVWLERGEMEKILGLPDDLFRGQDRPDPKGAAACPDCHVSMKTVWFSMDERVLIDRCEQCGGVWLDAEELRELVQEVYRHKERTQVLVGDDGHFHHRSGDCPRLSGEPRTISWGSALAQEKTACSECSPLREPS